MKETLPFTRGREKEGLVYSLNVSCLAEQSSQARPVHQSRGRCPCPSSNPSLTARVSAQQRAGHPRGRREGEPCSLLFFVSEQKVNMPLTQVEAGDGPMFSWKLQAKTRDSGRESIRGIQDGETASLGRRRLRAKEGLAGWMEGGGGGWGGAGWGWQEGRAGQRRGGLHHTGMGLHTKLTPFQTRERGVSGRRGGEETKEMRKTRRPWKEESGERRGDGGRKRARERPRAKKDSHSTLWNGLCRKRTW